MPIPLADRRGQLNTPNVQPGKAISPAENIQNIGQIASNTLRLMSKATDDMGKAIVFRQRQDEQLAAQDALTEYLAGREKLDSVRNSLALENALNFEDEYYKQAQKMHAEFVNKINKLQYSDIRERVRGQANNTNIQTAAQSENFFWKQKEAVADNHTTALVDAKTRQVVNAVNSNPGMDDYNNGNIANGYAFVLDTLKNRLMEKGYRDGTPEMDLAMSQAKDRYFAQVLEEVSHRPDDGLAIAHKLGVHFKKQMSPEMYNKVMKPISANNLAMELTRDASRFFVGGDTLNGAINDKAAAQYAEALDPWERAAFLESFQKKEQAGNSAAKAAQDTAFSREFRIRQGEWLAGMIGDSLGLISGEKELDKLSKEQRKQISAQLLNKANPIALMNQMSLWENAINGTIYAYKLDNGEIGYSNSIKDGQDKFGDVQPLALALTEEDKTFLRSRVSILRRFLSDNPELFQKGLKGTMFGGKKPTVAEVAAASLMTQANKAAQQERWWEPINVFNIFGEPPTGQRNYTAMGGLQRAASIVSATYGDRTFDDLSATEKRAFWNKLSVEAERQTSAEYAESFGSDSLQSSYQDASMNAIFRDIEGNGSGGFSPYRWYAAANLKMAYYGTKQVGEAISRFTVPRAIMRKPTQKGFAMQVARMSSANNLSNTEENYTDLTLK